MQLEHKVMSCYTVPHHQSPSVTDYTVPLHVDCSVEYELPECAKPPQGVKIEPLLMIHPCHFRNLERQRRRPFENNLPNVRNKRRVTPYTASWEAFRRPTPSLPPPAPHEPYTCQALASWTWREPLPHLQPALPRYEAV